MAMELGIAAKILRKGMDEGWFTGKRFATYLPARLGTVGQFEEARRIINGTDKAVPVASYARHFQTALEAGGWK